MSWDFYIGSSGRCCVSVCVQLRKMMMMRMLLLMPQICRFQQQLLPLESGLELGTVFWKCLWLITDLAAYHYHYYYHLMLYVSTGVADVDQFLSKDQRSLFQIAKIEIFNQRDILSHFIVPAKLGILKPFILWRHSESAEVSEWVEFYVSVPLDTVSHFGDESFQTISWQPNSKQTREIHEKTEKLITEQTNWP